MKITNMEFDPHETGAIYALVGSVLLDQGKTRKQIKTIVAGLTPQNVIRLALGLPLRNRGGSRPNAGRPKEAKQQKPE